MKHALLVLSFWLSIGTAGAHDFWIEPSTFSGEAGATLTVSLQVGEHFDGKPVGRNPRLLERFLLIDEMGERSIPGAPGRDPAGRIDLRGPAAIVYQGRPSYVELPAARFEAYLIEEGLEGIVRERLQRGESNDAGRELFSRSARSLLGPDPGPRGLRLELLFVEQRSGTVTFELLFDGEPAGDVRVAALSRAAPGHLIAARTDQKGHVDLSLTAPGVWLVKAVHMKRSSDPRAEWRSDWASLTFQHRTADADSSD